MEKFVNCLLFMFFLVFTSCALQSQAMAAILWEKTYAGEYGLGAYGYHVQQTTDGGYVVAGKSIVNSSKRTESSIIKFDASGTCTWEHGAEMSLSTWGQQAVQVDSDHYFEVGTAVTSDNSRQILLSGAGGDGRTRYVVTKGLANYDEGCGVVRTTDNHVVITGYVTNSSDQQVCLIKYQPNASGDPTLKWETAYGISGRDCSGKCVQTTADGGFAIVGCSGTSADENMGQIYLIKTSSSGQKEWEKLIGGPDQEGGNYLIQCSQGGYMIVGATKSYGSGDYDIYLVKTNSSGDVEWTKCFGGSGEDRGYSIQETQDGGYIIAGTTMSYSTDRQIIVIKLDSTGKQVWQTLLGGGNDSAEGKGCFLIQRADGNYIVAGSKDNKVYLACLENILSPQIANKIPADGATGVGLQGEISAEFSEEVQAQNLSGITVKDNTGSDAGGVVGTIDETGKILKIQHSTLKSGTPYTVAIPADTVKSKNSGIGNEATSWQFTTLESTLIPTYTSPYDGQTEVDRDVQVIAMFDEEVLAQNLAGVTIKDSTGTGAAGVTAAIAEDGKTLMIQHNTFKNSETYTVTIPAGAVKSKASLVNSLEKSWQFTVEGQKLTVSYVSPYDGQEEVDTDSQVFALFDEEIIAQDLSGIVLNDSQGISVGGAAASIDEDGKTLLIQHNTFKNTETYTVTIPAGAVKSKASGIGNSEKSWQFTIKERVLTASYVSPYDGQEEVDADSQVLAVFDEEVIAEDLSGVTINNSQGTGVEGIAASIEQDGKTLLIQHDAFANNETYIVTIPSGAVKSKDNEINNTGQSWQFTVEEPRLAEPFISPYDGQEEVDINGEVFAAFDEEIAAQDLSGITIQDGQGTAVEGIAASIDETLKILSIEHPAFKYGETYIVTIPVNTVKSRALGVTNKTIVWSFTTDIKILGVNSTLPHSGQTGVGVDKAIEIYFSDKIAIKDLAGITIKDSLAVNVEGVAAVIGQDEKSLLINHSPFKNSETYSVNVPAGVVTSQVNGMDNQAVRWQFTTVPPTGPELLYYSPDGGFKVATDTEVMAVFETDIELQDVTGIKITDNEGVIVEGVTGTIGDDGQTLIIPHEPLKNGTVYTATIPAGAIKSKVSGVGNAEISWQFTTIDSEGTLHVSGVWVDPETLVLTKSGPQGLLNVIIMPVKATNKNLVWSSSDPSVATVDNGLVTPIAAGTTTITATSEDSGLSDSCEVTVTVPVTAVNLNKNETILTMGQTETLVATIEPADATNKAVTWSSSNSDVATVNSNGLVTAISPGLATITAATDDGGKTAACEVTVNAPDGPDLAVKIISSPEQYFVGSKVNVVVEVSNPGNGSSNKAVLNIYIGDQRCLSKNVSKLKPKSKPKMINGRFTVPNGLAKGSAILKVEVVTDPDVNEFNNTVQKDITVVLPDLTITSFSPKKPLIAGKSGTFTVGIANQTDAAAGKFVVQIYRGNERWAEKKVSSLKKGLKNLSIGIRVPANYNPTSDILRLVIDPLNQVAEQDETNNEKIYP